jgi:hypothetical protein
MRYFTTVRKRWMGTRVEWTARLIYKDQITGKWKERSKSVGCLNDEDTAGPSAFSNQIKVAARVLNHQSLRVGSIILEVKLPVIEEAEVNPKTGGFADF